ncbi:S-layer homology domain-containing protein [Paenibacillus chibensis]|nr:S-layer homology domain-containing protein [Paenibacillus chibensis]MEC0370563.1 S-layer homology domain-containing protein [Paenibacillus chibensis]
MSKWRPAMAGLLALLLILSAFPAYAAENSGEISAQGTVPGGQVMIKNKWKSNVLYEASDGTVRYGLPGANDESARWIVESADGVSTIKNAKTGHYISIAQTSQRSQPLKTVEAGASDKEKWSIEPSSREGYMVIRSAAASGGNAVIHEEDQLGFAEASADINITFESPQWAFVPVDNRSPVQLESRQRVGQVMVEKDGKVQYAKAEAGDMNAQWYLEPGDIPGSTLIRNRATGHLVTQNTTTWAGALAQDPDSKDPSLSEWLQKEAPDASGYVIFENVSSRPEADTENPITCWLHTQFDGDQDVRSNNWPGDLSNPSAQWRIVQVTDMKPVRIAAYSNEQTSSDFWYEANGQVKHGSLQDAGGDSLALWYIEDFDGNKRIRNASTGHYVTYGGSGIEAVAANAGEAQSQWVFRSSKDVDDYQTMESIAASGSYIAAASDGSLNVSTDASSLESQWQIVDPTASSNGEQTYIRIQNEWQPFYLYEQPDGTIKYGNQRTGDRRDQWSIEKYNGRKLFKNRETGHYMNIQDMPEGHIQATAITDPQQVEPGYMWSVKDLGGGTYLITSMMDYLPGKDADKFVSLQNLTKYAEYGVINPNWGSPHWKFITVSENKQQLFRFKLKDSNEYLYEKPTSQPTVGQVTYGDVEATDPYSIWFLEDSGNAVLLKNQGSGFYIALENIAGHEAEDDPAETVQTLKEIQPSWASVKWYVQKDGSTGLVRFKSGWAGHYLYAAADDSGAPALKMSKAPGAENKDAAQFEAIPVQAAAQPIPDQPVRIQSAANGQYLYENKSGVVLYGKPAADNGYSQWLIGRDGDRQTIRNRGTGHYLTLNKDYSFLESKGDTPQQDGTSFWSVTRSGQGDSVVIRSLFGDADDELVNVQNNAGYAERGLWPASWGSVQWKLETAAEKYTTPSMEEPRNLATSTPVQDDLNQILIRAYDSNQVLAEQGGRLTYVNSSEPQASAKWLLQDMNGRFLLKNAASGRYLSIDDKLGVQTVSGTSGLNVQWNIEEHLGYRTLTSAKAEGSLRYADRQPEYGLSGKTDTKALWSFEKVASNVVYPANQAFSSDDVLRFAVHAQADGEYEAHIGYKSDLELNISVSANGLDAQTISLKGGIASNTAAIKLKLRAGMNTVSVEGSPNAFSPSVITSLTVDHSTAKSYRGATLPYISYEAEDTKTNGEVIGPSRKYRSLASEASGRQAVTLQRTGDYVEFPLAKAANTMVLRYSIPDDDTGQGKEETLSLYINGVFKQSLHLTSKYAWEYGSYPWSNDPRQGSAHRFYDEIHAKIGDVPEGAVIRLEKSASDHAASYTLDLIDMEQVGSAYSMPEGFLSVTDFGAVPDDGADDTGAFRQALAEAEKQGKGVWFPAGTFEVGDGLLDLNSAIIRGAGMWNTTLNGAKFFGHGGRVEVYDLLIDGGINVRDDEAFTNAFHGAFGSGSVIQSVWIEHTKAGLWLTQPVGEKARTNGLYMMGLRIRDLMADGINFAVGTSNSMMEQSDIRYPGDDGIAMWSFTDAKLKDVNGDERTPSVNNTARFNTVSLPWLADNIVVFGGKDNKIQDNIAKDTIANGAGIAVSTRFTAEPFGGTTLVERNTLLRTGSYDSGYGVNLGAIWLYAGESSMNGEVIVRNNTVKDSTFAGLLAHGDFDIKHVLLNHLVIDGTGTNGIEATSGVKGLITVDNVIIRNDRMNMVSNPSTGLRFEEINQGFASVYKEPPVVDPGDPGAPGGGDGGSGGNSGSNGGSSGAAGASHTAAADAALQTAAAKAQPWIELKTDENGEIGFSAKALLAAAAADPDGSLKLIHGDLVYIFPLKQTEDLLKRSGGSDPNAVIRFAVSQLDAARQERLSASAKQQAITLIGLGFETSISVIRSGEAASVQNTSPLYLIRQYTLNEALNPQRSTVLLYDEASGTFRSVPALFAVENGHTVVTVKSTVNGVFTVAQVHPVMTDITGHWAQSEIEQLASKLIIKGEPDGRFAPGRAVTRAEFASMLFRALDLSAEGNDAPAFKDVGGAAWYSQAVGLAARLGIVTGYEDGTFRPNRTITREEMAVMAERAIRLIDQMKATASEPNGPIFKDAGRISAWAKTAVEFTASQGLVTGLPSGEFKPDQTTSRAEAAVMIKRILVALKLINE